MAHPAHVIGSSSAKSPAHRRLAAVALVLAGAAALQGCKSEVQVAERPAAVRVATVALEPLAETRRYVGVVRARYESDLGFRVAGKIVERLVNVGDEVKAGQVIARLDATDFSLALQSQDAELAAAKSSRDQAVAAEERYKILKSQGHVAEAALDIRRAAADEARARVERAERQLAVQRNQVAYTDLKAEHDGVVSALFAEAGQVVAAGQAVARVAQLRELEAVVAIPEQKLDEAKSASASLELWGAGAKQYQAKLREIAPEADRVARTFEARFSILAPDQDIQLGKTANILLTPANTDVVARVPLSAVMNDAKGPMVWVVDASGETLERRAVTIKSFGQEFAYVASGLAAGERIVALGGHTLDETKHVRIIETVSMAGTRRSWQ